MKSMATVCVLALALISCAAPESSVFAQDSSKGVIRSMLKFSQWTVEDHAPAGFVFVSSDYAALAGWTAGVDNATLRRLAWNQSGGYSVAIVRSVSFSDQNGNSVDLRITVESTARRARNGLIKPYDEASTPPSTTRYGGDFSLNVGAAALIDDVPPGTTTLAASDVVTFTFIRYNVEVRLKKTAGCSIDLVALATALDTTIVRQADTVPTSPEVSLSLGFSEVDTSNSVDGTNTDVSLTCAITPKPSSKQFFSGGKSTSAVDEDGNEVLSQLEVYFGASSGFTFDENSSPPTFRVYGGSQRGEYKVGVVAWGNNLWPRIVTCDFKVK